MAVFIYATINEISYLYHLNQSIIRRFRMICNCNSCNLICQSDFEMICCEMNMKISKINQLKTMKNASLKKKKLNLSTSWFVTRLHQSYPSSSSSRISERKRERECVLLFYSELQYSTTIYALSHTHVSQSLIITFTYFAHERFFFFISKRLSTDRLSLSLVHNIYIHIYVA